MAVNRLWFPNAPSSSVGLAQRTQLALGYSGITVGDTIAAFIIYLRRYLNDL